MLKFDAHTPIIGSSAKVRRTPVRNGNQMEQHRENHAKGS